MRPLAAWTDPTTENRQSAVRQYRRHLRAAQVKLHASTRAHLVVQALRSGLINLENPR
jgi:hypothetical protein